jgi:hypothetical protein
VKEYINLTGLFRRGESFHAWRMFASGYPEDFNQPGYRYQLEIKQPSLPLPDYFKGIASPTTNWLTSLRISPRQISSSDLISIAKISNLAVLDLSDGQVTIDDTPSTFNERIMRTWVELANTENAFRYLRVLLIGWQNNLSAWIFKYLDSFPSLCYLLITDCRQLHQRNRGDWEEEALSYGWDARHAKKSAKSLKPILDDKTFSLGAVSGCYYHSQDIFEQLANGKMPDMVQRLPVLECSIGTPRLWTHIIDEFPGMRTIWFDNVKTASNQSKGKPIEASLRLEQVKRGREVETSTTEEVRKLKPRRNMRNAVELLAEFDSL